MSRVICRLAPFHKILLAPFHKTLLTPSCDMSTPPCLSNSLSLSLFVIMLGHHGALGLLSVFLILQSYVYSQTGFDELKIA